MADFGPVPVLGEPTKSIRYLYGFLEETNAVRIKTGARAKPYVKRSNKTFS